MTDEDLPTPGRVDLGDDDDDGEDRPPRHARDNWDRFTIIARPATALLGALLIGSLGYLADQALKASEEAATLRVEKAESYRLYTELMSRREESESLLRQEMFKAVLDEFFAGTSDSDDMARAMLKLEMLALNFGESLSLSPLFVELDKQIEALENEPDDPFWKVKQDHFRHRLHSLARRVSSWQLSTLGAGGVTFEFNVPVDAATTVSGFTFPSDVAAEHLQGELEAIPDMSKEAQNRYFQEQSDLLRLVSLKGIQRSYTISFRRADPVGRTVEVSLQIADVSAEPGALGSQEPLGLSPKPIDLSFELNFYNFPMIDNTRLIGDQRFGLVMVGFDTEGIQVAGVVFPGSYASQRDRPFLTDVLERLRAGAQPSTDDPTTGDEPG